MKEMRTSMRGLRVIGAIVGLSAALAAPSSADIAVDVSPVKYELQSQPGKQETFPITVRNTSAAPVHIVASLADYSVGPTGNYAFTAPGKSPFSLSREITINPREFDLEPNSFTQVRFSVDVPSGANGEYSNLVFFTTRPTRKGGGLSVVERIASKIYVMIPESTRIAGEVADVKAQALEDGEHYLVEFKNTGNAHVYLSGRVEVKQGNAVVDRVTFPQGMLVERSGKRLIDAVGKKLAAGSYSVVAMVDYGGQNLVAGQANITVR
jgi:P pilus assembly chaperone PapD